MLTSIVVCWSDVHLHIHTLSTARHHCLGRLPLAEYSAFTQVLALGPPTAAADQVNLAGVSSLWQLPHADAHHEGGRGLLLWNVQLSIVNLQDQSVPSSGPCVKKANPGHATLATMVARQQRQHQ